MNAERLNLVAKGILGDIRISQSEVLIDQLKEHLLNQISNPTKAEYQKSVSSTLGKLTRSLEKAPSNDFAPTWIQAIEKFNASELLGEKLRQNLESIFARNKITPSAAHDEILEIAAQIKKLKKTLTQIVYGLTTLNIGEVQLDPNQCEIGIFIPREFIKNNLENFVNELFEIRRILDIFSEINTGSRPGFEIREISSSDLTIFLEALPAVGLMLAVTLERLIIVYQRILDIKIKRKELQALEVPGKSLRGIEDYANESMEKEIDKLAPALLDRFLGGDKSGAGRKNELEIELKSSLRKIANRLDRGFNIEVRVETPIENEKEESSNESQEVPSIIEEINSKSKILQFLKVGGTPILSLSESNPKENKDKEKVEGKDKKS